MECPDQSHTLLLRMRTTHIVYLLIISNNHFNKLKVKGQTKSTDFQKIKNLDYKKLESKVVKPEQDHSFMGEFSSVYSQNTLNDIKQYLENNIYPQEIDSLSCAFMKK